MGVDARPVGHRHQQGADGAAEVEAPSCLDQLHEGVLDDVLGQGGIVGPRQAVAVEDGEVLPVQVCDDGAFGVLDV
jgi:hypothetical protein